MATQEKLGNVFEVMEDLKNRYGDLKPSTVLDEARKKDSPLHSRFTWDDGEAAEKWRLEEARDLISKYRMTVVYEERELHIPIFTRDPRKEQSEEGYVTLTKAKERQAVDIVRNELECVISLLVRTLGIAHVKTDDLPKGTVSRINNSLKEIESILESL